MRADRATNFLADYRKILDVASTAESESLSRTDPKAALAATLNYLERPPYEWLLVLDNADDIDLFQKTSMDDICLLDYLPRYGRTLVTTRDSRLVGQLSLANDGLQVRSLESEEALDLLLKSTPLKLTTTGRGTPDEQALDLAKELGNLPLAIAQAAANIRHLRTSLSSYTKFYKERKSRTELLEQHVHDSKMPPQSVLITWQISFEHVQKSNPTAAELLCYLGFLHWQSIPGALLRLFPEIDQLNELQFTKAVGELLHLSLLDQPSEDEFSLHPMVRYWISTRLTIEERSKRLISVLGILAGIFPARSYDEKTLCRSLLPHALEVINQADEITMVVRSLARLMQVVAYFLMWMGISNWSLRLISKALDLGESLWSPEDAAPIYLRKFKGRCLAHAGRHEEAVVDFRKCLENLDTVTKATDREKADERFHLNGDLANSLLGSGKTQEKEAEEIREVVLEEGRARLSSLSPSEETLNVMARKHTLSKSLIRLHQFDKAPSLVDEILDWADNAGKGVVSEEVFLPWMSDRADILARQDKTTEALAIHSKVLRCSLSIHKSGSEGRWIAVYNVASSLFELKKYEELEQLVHDSLSTMPTDLMGGRMLHSALGVLNLVAVMKQRQARYKEAEQLHRLILDWDGQWNEPVSSFVTASTIRSGAGSISHFICAYNLSLCLARQGRMEEVKTLRLSHKDGMEKAEAIYGPLEQRLGQDARDVEIYNEARQRLLNKIGTIDDAWWIENKKFIQRGEDRFGRLDANQMLAEKAAIAAQVQANPPQEGTSPKSSIFHDLVRFRRKKHKFGEPPER